jgi:hypothetical protein
MKPCQHTEPLLPDPFNQALAYCQLCYLYEVDEDYRRLWDGPQGESSGSGLPPPVVLKIKRPLPCVYLGKLVRRNACRLCPRSDVRCCDLGHGTISQANECETCPDYDPEQSS